MKPSSYTFTVAPLTVLPFQKTLFSYVSQQKLGSGTVVTIPLSGRTLLGVVMTETVAPPNQVETLKSIISVEEQLPLTKEQLTLAKKVSEMTFTPLGKVLKHFVPKKAGVKKNKGKVGKPVLRSFAENKEVAALLKVLVKEKNVFFPLGSQVNDLETLGLLVQKLVAKNEDQVMLLVPDISTAVRLENAWEDFFPKNSLVSLYHTKTPGQYFQAWQQVQTGEAKIIIATRSGLFAPFKSLGTIIQLDPTDEAYKQWDMSPRYHAQFVIPSLQELWDATFIAVAPLPPLVALKEGTPTLPVSKTLITPEWVNLKTERFQKNWSVLSLALQDAMRNALQKGEQVLLYVHQSGLESFSVCTECRTIFRCPSCNALLRLSASDHYQCKHCRFQSSLFPQCPNCKNIHFKSVGSGTEKIAREVKKVFPGARTIVADKKHLSDHKKVLRFINEAAAHEPDILVSTASFLRFPPLSRLAVVAIIDADTLLNLPGFRKDEQFIELITRSSSLLAPDGKIIVQTFHPENDIFQKITKGTPLAILQQLLEERLELCYPPYYRALVLEARPKKKDGAKLLQATSKSLKECIAKHPEKKKLLLQTATRMERGRAKPYTLLRYQPPLAPEIQDFLTKKADTVFIDHDPLHIT